MSAVTVHHIDPNGPFADDDLDFDVEIKQLADAHRAFYDSNERALEEIARDYYNGRFELWAERGRSGRRVTGTEGAYKNLIYSVTDTAVTALLDANPQVIANARNPETEEKVPDINGYLAWAFAENDIRQKAEVALIDAVLARRGCLKTLWDRKSDRPVVTTVEPGRLFFDPSVRHPDEAAYWLEAGVIRWEVFKQRCKAGVYRHKRLGEARGAPWPEWVSRGRSKRRESLLTRSSSRWIVVWEYYDRIAGVFCHYVEGVGVVYQEPLTYIPYSMFTLNANGEDLGGLSDAQLILGAQETINDLLTLLKMIAYRLVPKILYDSGAIDSDELAKAIVAPVGSFVGLKAKNSDAQRSFGAYFHNMPLPESPQAIADYIDRMESIAAETTALAEMSRGKVINARTATEIALVKSSVKDRLTTRAGHFGAALEDVAAKILWLSQCYMRTPKDVESAGGVRWRKVGVKSLRDVAVRLELVTTSPLRKEPGVVAELLQALYPLLSQSPVVKRDELDRALVKLTGLPEKLAKTAQELSQEAQMAAAQSAQPQMPTPGGVGGDLGALMAAAQAGQEEGVTPPPEGAVPAPGAQAEVMDLNIDPAMLQQLLPA